MTLGKSRRKHVAVLNQFASPRSSPGGTRHVELFSRLANWDATVVAGNRQLFDQSRVANDGILRTVPVTRYSGNGVSRVINWASFSASALFTTIKMRRLDAVYGSSPHMGAAVAGLIVSKARRVPLVLEVRDLWPVILLESGMFTERSRIYRTLKALERFLYRQADAIVILAEGSREPIISDGGDPASIHFIPNGADVGDFVSSENREALRQRHGFDGLVCVYAGAHGPANGLAYVLDAAEQLAATAPNARFVLYGDGVEKEQLVAAAKTRGLTSVEFRDPVPKEEIAEIFAAADVGIHCLADVDLFKYGVSPNKLYDYMASGLPVITNTGGEVAEMVTSADAGVACPPDGIADAVAYLATAADEELAAFAENGRSFVEQHRSREAMAERVESILDQLTP